MIGKVLTKVFGSKNERFLKEIQPLVNQVNELEPSVQPLDDAALAAKTIEFKERVEKGETLDALLPESFAVIREASKRTLGERHFDVQILGGIVLHKGMIAEMKTGEGKTLTSTLAVYLNSLGGRGVHVVTVNDYLASRDAEWMGQLYRSLGLSVGRIIHGMEDPERREAYGADVTYGTNNEFGFEYLRDLQAFFRGKGASGTLLDNKAHADEKLVADRLADGLVDHEAEAAAVLERTAETVGPAVGVGG